MALDSLFAIARGVTRGREGVRRRRQEEAELARTRELEDEERGARAADRATRDLDTRLRRYEQGFVPAETPDDKIVIKGIDVGTDLELPRYEEVPGLPGFKRDRTRTPEAKAARERYERITDERTRDQRELEQERERLRLQHEYRLTELGKELAGGKYRDRSPTGIPTATGIASFLTRAPQRTKFTKRTLTGGTVVDEEAYQQAVRSWRAGGQRLGLTDAELDEVLEPGDAPGGGEPVVTPTPERGPDVAQLRREAEQAIARGANREAVAARFRKLTGQPF